MIKKTLSALFVCLLTVVTCFGCNKVNYKKALEVKNYSYELTLKSGTEEIKFVASTHEGTDQVSVHFGEVVTEEFYTTRDSAYRHFFNKTENWSEGATIYQYSYKAATASQHIDILKVIGTEGIDSKGKLTEAGEAALKAWAPRAYTPAHTLETLLSATPEVKDFKLTVKGDKVSGVSFTLTVGEAAVEVTAKYSNHNKTSEITLPKFLTPYEG